MRAILVSMKRIGIITALLFVLPCSVGAASLYLDPSDMSVGLSDTFVLSVRLDPKGDCVNAGKVVLTYPTESLKAVDFSRGNSIFSLWVEEPKFDSQTGTISFSGGVPGGYCGRIPGDPSLTNVLGKVIFTVVGAQNKNADVNISPESELYLNDGLGTSVRPELTGTTLEIQETPVLTENPWVKEVNEDKIPPDPFDVQVESTRGIFGGKYYAVFATTDKQSGIDHYEIFEKGGWKRATSPYKLADQSLTDKIVVKAIDKAGNETLGAYAEGSAPPRQYEFSDFLPLYIVLILLVFSWFAKRYLDRRSTPTDA